MLSHVYAAGRRQGTGARLRNATSAAATPATSAGDSIETSEEHEPEDDAEEEEEVRLVSSASGKAIVARGFTHMRPLGQERPSCLWAVLLLLPQSVRL